MNAVYAAAADLQEFVQSKGWPFCFIGGIAVQRWAYPRATDDADMTVFTQVFRDEECIRELLKRFAPFYPDSAERAPMLRVLFMQHANGVKLDVALGAFEFEEHSIARASWWEPTKGVRLFTCSAEDLIVHKAYASRPQDLADIENILSVQGARLDVKQILQELAPLAELKEDSGIITTLEHMLQKRRML
jgi:predicted nucleotidyltransferase